MKCKELEELLSDYLEGNLNPAVEEEVDAHLAGCSRCREKMRGMRALMGRLNDLEMVEPSAGFEARLWGQLRRESSPRSRGWAFSPLSALAALFLLVAAGYLLLSRPPLPRSYLISEADVVKIRPSVNQLLGADSDYRTREAGVSLGRFRPQGDSLSQGRTRYVLPVISNQPQVEATSF